MLYNIPMMLSLENREERIDKEIEDREKSLFKWYTGHERLKSRYLDRILEEWERVFEFRLERPVVNVIDNDDTISSGISILSYWIEEYEKMHAGDRDPISINDVVWEPYGDNTEEPIYTVADIVKRWARSYPMLSNDDNEIEDFYKHLEGLDVRPVMNATLLSNLARLWVPGMIDQRSISIDNIKSDVILNVKILELLQSGEYKNRNEAEKAILLERDFNEKKESIMGVRTPPIQWTLEDLVSNFEFIIGWANQRRRQKYKGELIDVGDLPTEIIRHIAEFVGAAREETVPLKSELEEFFFDFYTTFDLRVGHVRGSRDVTDMKIMLRIVKREEHPRKQFEKFEPHIRRIREHLVRDIEWLNDKENLNRFLHQMFNESFEYIDLPRYPPPGMDEESLDAFREKYKEKEARTYLEMKIEDAISILTATQDWVLQIFGSIESIVDDRDTEGKKKEYQSYVTSRVRRRRRPWLLGPSRKKENIDFEYLF